MDFGFLLEQAPALRTGLENTLTLAIIAIPAGLLIGLAAAAIVWLRVPGLTVAVTAYVELFRATPNLVQVFFLFFVLPSVGLRLDAFMVGLLALGLWGGAYNTENFRAGFASVNRGLLEASVALGFTRLDTLRFVVVPLGARIAIPSLTNISISVLKATSLMTVIGYPELTSTALTIIYSTFRVNEIFLALGVLYLALVWTVSWIAHRFARRWRVVGV